MLKSIVVAGVATLALTGAASAQVVVANPSGTCEKMGATGNGPPLGRDAVEASEACIAMRGVVPGQARAPLSREELISIILLSTLQTMPNSRGS
jgi:hypothetical protein